MRGKTDPMNKIEAEVTLMMGCLNSDFSAQRTLGINRRQRSPKPMKVNLITLVT